MNEDEFEYRKKSLIELIEQELNRDAVTRHDKNELKVLLDLINQYFFANRLQRKGLLSHTIVDSLDLNYALGEKFIRFDKDIK